MNYGRRRTIVAARTALEAQEKKHEEIKAPETRQETVPEVKGRGMCPKCGVKPNHYFHVKHCKG